MINQNYIWLALFIIVYGNFFYLRDTLKGETKPNRVTFILWGIAPLITFFAQKEGGGSIQIFYTLLIALAPIVIFAASFHDKNAYWKISKFDVSCGIISILALVLLVITNNPLLALWFSVLADLFAAIPTLIKSYKYPLTETTTAYAFEVIGSVIVLLTIHNWILVNYLFAAYTLLTNALFTSLQIFSPKNVGRRHGFIASRLKAYIKNQ